MFCYMCIMEREKTKYIYFTSFVESNTAVLVYNSFFYDSRKLLSHYCLNVYNVVAAHKYWQRKRKKSKDYMFYRRFYKPECHARKSQYTVTHYTFDEFCSFFRVFFYPAYSSFTLELFSSTF